MALGAHDVLGVSIERTLVITKDGHVAPQIHALPNVEIHESAHPVPDKRSLAAGEGLLQWLSDLPRSVEALFLISGGASSLVEVLEEGVVRGEGAAAHRAGARRRPHWGEHDLVVSEEP